MSEISHQIVLHPEAQLIVVDPVTKQIAINPTGTIGPRGPEGPQGPAGPTPTVNAYAGQGPFTIRILTQSEFDALTPDANTIYYITGP